MGIYCKLGSTVLFCTMDAMVKGLGGTYGSFQLMLFRSAIALLPIRIRWSRTEAPHVEEAMRDVLQ